MQPATSDGQRPKRHDWAEDDTLEARRRVFSVASPNNQRQLEGTTSGTSVDSQAEDPEIRKARGTLGLHPHAPIDEEHQGEERQELFWSRVRIVLREPFAEFWGVVIMVLFGNGSVAQVLLSMGQVTAPGGNGFGAYQSISWG